METRDQVIGDLSYCTSLEHLFGSIYLVTSCHVFGIMLIESTHYRLF